MTTLAQWFVGDDDRQQLRLLGDGNISRGIRLLFIGVAVVDPDLSQEVPSVTEEVSRHSAEAAAIWPQYTEAREAYRHSSKENRASAKRVFEEAKKKIADLTSRQTLAVKLANADKRGRGRKTGRNTAMALTPGLEDLVARVCERHDMSPREVIHFGLRALTEEQAKILKDIEENSIQSTILDVVNAVWGCVTSAPG